MNIGWLKLFRKLSEHWIWQDKPFAKGQAWIDLMMRADIEEHKILLGGKIITLKAGSFVTSMESLAKDWGWTRKKTISFMKLLESDKMIEVKGTTKGTIVTLCNWDLHQDKGTTKGTTSDTTKVQQKYNEGTTTDTLNKNIEYKKKEYNKKEEDNLESAKNEFLPQPTTPSIEDRREAFRKDVAQYLPQYDSNMLNDFFMYWTEANVNGKKMKFEMQKTWNTSLRLSFWKKREKGFGQKEKRPVGDVANSINVMNKILNR